MSNVALRKMSLEEFLQWEDGTDTRYELIGGFPVAMAPPRELHGAFVIRLGSRIDAALAGRRPCRAISEAGILDSDRADTFFVADIGVTCAPYDGRRQHLENPILLVEILSPSTERHDRRVKIPAYQQIPSVQEILVVDSGARYAALHRRQGEQWIIQISRGDDGVISLASVGIEIPLAELYEGFVFEDEESA
jgi:Uma2 family endonuclease